MKIKKIYIVIVLASLSIFLIFFLHSNKKDASPKIVEQEQIPVENIKVKIPTEKADIDTIKVSLVVSDKEYKTEIKNNSSVFDAMKKIEEESTKDNMFSFKYTNNASLGNFVTEINGHAGTPGKYWIYYVNNLKASVGVSNYVLKSGDIIKWSQEGI